MMKIFNYLSLTVVLLIQTSFPSFAYLIAQDCETLGKTNDVTAAISAWEKMTTYAIGRATDPNKDHRQGNLLQAMFGAKDEHDADTLAYVKQWLSAALTAMRDGTRIVFTCTDAHLLTLDGPKGIYQDNTYGKNMRVHAPRGSIPAKTNNACGGINEAFTYSPAEDKIVIVLCSDWDGSALKAYKFIDLDPWRTAKLEGLQAMQALGINFFSMFLAYKIAHEIMHATDMTQFPAMLPGSNPQDAAIPELYQYKAITGQDLGQDYKNDLAPSQVTRQHNADSMALLLCGWYIRANSWYNGVPKKNEKGKSPPETYEPATRMRFTRAIF